MSTELSAASFIKGYEGYTESAMWDVDAWRIGHGSDTITFADGTYRRVNKGDKTTPENALKDLARRIKREFIPRVQKDIGGVEYWDNLNEGCRIALLDFAYNYGSIVKKQIREAAKTGNPIKIADAILISTKDDNKRLLHVDNDPKKPLKTGKDYEKAVKMRKTLYKRREAEAALCLQGSHENRSQGTSEGSGGISLISVILSAFLVVGLIWLFL